jgi:glycosyltransferase involved in cell wall biosynthesis
VIVLCFDRLEFTRHCTTALARHTRPPRELIAVDDGSTDGTADYLAGVHDAAPFGVRVVTNEESRGFAAACNQGIAAARGDYVVLLDAGCVVTDGWVDQLVALADSDPAIGMTGPMSNRAAPPQRVADVPYADLESMHRFAGRWRTEHRGQWFTPSRLSGPCALLKRAVLQQVGGLDERLAPEPSFEDLSVRVAAAGYRLAVAHDVFVHGFGGGTSADAALEAQRGREPSRPAIARARSSSADRASQPKVSLTMIVRDEEKHLPACLASAEGLFDEIVVVDTGSTDRTVEVARSFGARVFDFVWVDDFAAARNAALEHASGEYAFWLDADDVIEPVERQRLETLLGTLRRGDDAAFVVRCACDPDGEGGGGETVVDHVRLFPLRSEIRWTYRVHEQILPALRRAGVPVRWSDVTVRHTGYADKGLRLRKLARDEAILLEELRDRPEDPFILFNLGSIAVERQDWRGALNHLTRSLEGSAPTDSITRKLHALIARSHQMLGETDRALAACALGLRADPNDAELLFREAVIRRNAGDRAGAERCWRRVLTLRRPQMFSSVDMGIYGHLTLRNLAALAEERGDRDEARRLWRAVLAERPRDVDATRARDRLAASCSINAR